MPKGPVDIEKLVGSWTLGQARLEGDRVEFAAAAGDLPAKCRTAYRWITTQALHSPFFDVEYGKRLVLGREHQRLEVAEGEAYSSFALLPLLTLMTSRRLLFVGAPGRGKTTMATLMALLAGQDLNETRRGIQHGHPQMTHSDLLGSPLPRDLVQAESVRDIRVHWRGWLTRRVKIIDEYNRIPTKTQSSLLSLLAEGYAEQLEQTVEAGRSAWFLTANDDSGGGTFPVITALKDRIDVVVRSTPFAIDHLEDLVARLEAATTPEAVVPGEVIFTEAELDDIELAVRTVPVPAEVLEQLGFLLGQLDFCRRASERLEFQNKDTLQLAGKRLGHVCNEDCPLDKVENLCSQTENGVSTRAYQNVLAYAKAMAYFRGEAAVSHEDVHNMLPYVLHDKLRPNPVSPFFLRSGNEALLLDRLTWIRGLARQAAERQAAYASVHASVAALLNEGQQALQGADRRELDAVLGKVREEMASLLGRHELNAPVHQDLLRLKELAVRVAARLAGGGR